MATRKCIELRSCLKSLFPDKLIRDESRASGFVLRERKIRAVPFFWTLVLGFGVGSERTISALRRAYERSTSSTVVPSSFYDRFDASLVRFLKAAVKRSLATFQASWTEIEERVGKFTDLIIVDSTVMKLHEKLRGSFPGCRTNSAPAAAKLHAVLSVRGKGGSTVALTSERSADLRKLRTGPWVRDRLLLFDLGYFKWQLFHRIRKNGGFFLTRLKQNANPTITKIHRSVRGNSIPLVGERLQDVLPRLKRETLDVEIEASFATRKHRGRARRAHERFRLVAIRNEDDGQYHLYVTNVEHDDLIAEEIANVYRYRWEIELIFKELKSGYRMDQLTSRRPHVVEAMIYCAILTLVVSRELLRHLASRVRSGAERVAAGRWWKLLANYAQELQLLVVRPRRDAHLAAGLVDTFLHEIVDPHTDRRPLLSQVFR